MSHAGPCGRTAQAHGHVLQLDSPARDQRLREAPRPCRGTLQQLTEAAVKAVAEHSSGLVSLDVAAAVNLISVWILFFIYNF